ncbi:MAG TPA: lipid-binding SYLF domain-containing protein [Nitrospiraceae bacterium]|jgi:lipid-binding SYLF domain-containing protein
MKPYSEVVLAVLLSTALFQSTLAFTGEDTKPEEESQRVSKAAQVLDEIMRADDHAIPEGLLERAYGIAVIPHVVKGAFIGGGRFGKGLISTRDGDDWGPPAFIEIAGGSIGFQIGVEATDLIMVFVEQGGTEALIDDKLKLGADASVAAGPVGRHAEIGTNFTLDAAIYSYSRSKGVFAGVSLDGSVISADDSSNHRVYGAGATTRNILLGNGVSTPEVVQPFFQALEVYAPTLETAATDR